MTARDDVDRSLLRDLTLSRATVDRSSALRSDASWLAERWADPDTRVLLVHDGTAPVRLGGAGAREDEAEGVGAAALAFVRPADVPDPDSAERALLGRDREGTTYVAALLPSADGAPAEATWAGLREVGSQLDARDAGLLVAAVALDNWHAAHGRCARCGAPTAVTAGGWVRRCPEDGSEHYPRTDPAVIVLVRDPDDRALLGRQRRWPEGWFSTLAGFVEPGESAEAAVRREVHEESGVRVGEVAYLGSQPWPFPSSLMLGYHGWTDDRETVADGEEIAEARFFRRDELAEACRAGEVRLPPPVSIARRLVERWYGAELPGDWSRPLPARP